MTALMIICGILGGIFSMTVMIFTIGSFKIEKEQQKTDNKCPYEIETEDDEK